MIDWTIQKARDAYSIVHWSGGYFDINGKGHLVCRPAGRADHAGIDLFELSKEIKAAGLSLPVLMRFSDIMRHCVETLCDTFDSAMQADGYRGDYTSVYPIKVNQQKSVVEKIIAHEDGRVGLAAGSKPELLAVLAQSRQDGGIVVCNGYKDREYIRLDLYVDGEDIDTTLPLHPLRKNEPYLLGIFFLGAYQEILDDMHNLFGDTDSVNVELKADGGYQLLQPQQGDTVDSVLRYVHFSTDDLLASYRAKIERATSLSAKNRETYLAELSEGLKGYTYLED